MISIRRNIFETNSSSTHAFAFYKQPKPEIDFENYEVIIDYYHKDADLVYPIHTFDDLESKLRYFYTVYCYEANPNDEGYVNQACKNFMEKIFNIFPKIKWVAPPQDQYEEVIYLEDVNYVFYDGEFSAHDELHHKLASEADIKSFLQNGVIFFGDRDAGNYYHSPWDDVWQYNKDIEKITSASG